MNDQRVSESRVTLKQVFGFDQFRGNQEEIINNVTEGKNALVLMPTGGGKSLCYQIPALNRPGTGIIVSPLIALMKDQVDALKKKGVAAAFLNSSISRTEQNEIEQALLDGHIKILYVSPERTMNPYFLNLLKRIEIALFAIDEAHCVSQWGHDFRPEYMQLGMLATNFPQIPRLALTATAGPATRKEIIKCLHLDSAETYISSFDRPNIRYSIAKKTTKEQNFQELIKFIKTDHIDDCGIVYCLSRKSTEEISDRLNKTGLTSYAYHAGLSIKYRDKVQDFFINRDKVIVVATIAFGMGIDKPNVRFVCHMDLPKSLESYYQETGRAGRDGLPAHAWMLYGLREIVMLKKMGNRGVSSAAVRRVNEEKLDAMLGLSETVDCRREVLLNYFDDPYSGPCENCDTCLAPVKESINATNFAITALTCVYETKQKFNVHYMIEMLTGIVTLAIRNNDNLALPSFNAGKDRKADFWYSVFRQLIACGYLKMEMDGRSILQLTRKALAILEGDEEVWLRRDYKKSSYSSSASSLSSSAPRKKATKKKVRKNIVPVSYKTFDGSDDTLFENLKIFRTELAKKKRTKTFKIFPDKTLKEMVEKRPTELHELEDIYGVGPKKLKKFGKIFLQALQELQ